MRKVVIVLLALLAFSVVPALAADRYVSDELVIMMRSGQGEQYKIIKMIKAGTPLEVLEDGENYLLVRAPDGTEGYVLKQFTTTETPKPMIIGRLQRENDNLKSQLKQLQGHQAELNADLENSRENHQASQAANTDLKKQLDAVQGKYDNLKERAANVLQLSTERDQLEKQNTELTNQVGKLQQEAENMLYTGAIRWFLAGGGVFLVGWMIGRSARKKKRGF